MLIILHLYNSISLRLCWGAHREEEVLGVLKSANGLDHLQSPVLCLQLFMQQVLPILSKPPIAQMALLQPIQPAIQLKI